MRRSLFIAVLVLATLSTLVLARQQTQTFACSWDHDGVNITGYAIVIDGTRTVVTPTCTGTGVARVCTAPITLTLGTTHTVTVAAFNDFGEAVSDPFVAGPPGKPAGVGVKK